MKVIFGTKMEMTQMVADDGTVTPVTVVAVLECVVTQLKTKDKDGYTAIQVGFGEKRRVSRAITGHIKGIFTGREGRGFRYIREARVDPIDGIQRGDRIDLASFSVGDIVDVVGISKGKGFAGVVKRHHFHGHPPTHGHKDQERMPGSIGAGGVQHVFKGLRMAGRMGGERVKVKNLIVMSVDSEQGRLLIKGALPGARSSVVMISAQGELKVQRSAPASLEALGGGTSSQPISQPSPSEVSSEKSDTVQAAA